MRILKWFVTGLILLALLACNLPRAIRRISTPSTPTATPYVMCTPPACRADEVYYCPGDCPGGCGTTCVTPTVESGTPTFAPTNTPEPTSTPTPIPESTATAPPPPKPPIPPPSQPPAGAPVIESFTADHTSIVEGETIHVTWKATGGTEAIITWMGKYGVVDGISNLNPDGGTVAIAPHSGPVILYVRNSAGTTQMTLTLTFVCLNPWVPELASAMQGKCPNPAETGWAAQQPFEHGFMLWLQPSQTIYVFFNDYGGQTYRMYPDNFKEGDPEFDPSLEPPVGLHQPIRGFGLVWRTYPDVRENLGWATAPESGFNTWRQSYQGAGTRDLTTWVKDINRRIYQLNPLNTWEIYTP